MTAFITDPSIRALLLGPYGAFPRPTAQTKSSFETRTSAINVTPTSQWRFSIQDIKDDSLWLSNEASIDEVIALRLVVQECQSRPAMQLLSGFSVEEVRALQEVAGDTHLDLSMRGVHGSDGTSDMKAATDTEKFLNTDSRRLRILNIYLVERDYILRCSSLFIQLALLDEPSLPSADGGPADRRGNAGSLQDLLVSAGISGSDTRVFALNCTRAVRKRIENLEAGSGWFRPQGGRDSLEIEWARSQLTEAIHIIDLMFWVLYAKSGIPTAEVILEWFRMYKQYGYFDEFELVSPLSDA